MAVHATLNPSPAMAALGSSPGPHSTPALQRTGGTWARVRGSALPVTWPRAVRSPRAPLAPPPVCHAPRAGARQEGGGGREARARTEAHAHTERLPTRRQALSTEPAASSTEEGAEAEAVPFEWKSNWYAIGCSADLDPTRPHPVMLLGRRLVLWKDPNWGKEGAQGSGASSQAGTAWRCFLDRCPHRLVPLSEGRIDETGFLQCSYHGWTFAGDGSCQGIPQAAASGPEHSAINSPRACAVPFPISEQRGVLFVWPDETPEAAFRAFATPPPMPVGVDDSFNLRSFSREVLYGYPMLGENVLDPSHLPFAHHGVGPLRRSSAKPYPVSAVDSDREGVRGFVGRLCEPQFPTFSPVHFQAPGLFTYHRSVAHMRDKEGKPVKGPVALESVRELGFEAVEAGEGGPLRITALYITPVAPGRSRLTTLEGSNTPPPKGLMGWVGSNRWLGHLFLQQVLDGDAYFLHAQEKVVESLQPPPPPAPASAAAGGAAQHTPNGSANRSLSSTASSSSSWLTSSAYFVPTSADRFVIAFRKWLQRYGGGQVSWPAEYSGAALEADWTPKKAVLDRYAGHTANCMTCQKALAQFRLAQKVVLALALAAVVAALRMSAPAWVRGSLVVLAAGLGAAGAALQKLVQLFIYTGYDHASK